MANLKYVVGTIVFSLVLLAGLTTSGSSSASELQVSDEEFAGPLIPSEQAVYKPKIVDDMNSIATLHTNKGDIQIELFETQMPITTDNFLQLAQSGFYDGTAFHRIINGFMIQGGDPNTKPGADGLPGTGGPGYTIADEFVAGENLTNVRGTISMANIGQPNTGGSQFFINLVDNSQLDFDKEPLTSKHPVFGQVVAGMDVVDMIAKVQTGAGDAPLEPVVIESIEIEKKNTSAESSVSTKFENGDEVKK